MVMQDMGFLAMVASEELDDTRVDNALREENALRDDTVQNVSRSNTSKARQTPGLDTRASTFFSGVSGVSHELAAARINDFDNEHSDEYFDAVAESEEGRLSKSLKSWMPNYRMKFLSPQPNPPRQPVFSARLGDQMKIKRADSSESIATQLSLFSCSSHGSRVSLASKRRRRRRKKRDADDEMKGEKSIWVELASKKVGALDKMLRMHAMYAQLETETEIFRRLPEEEKVMVTEAGTRKGVVLGPRRQRSDSASNVHKKLPEKKSSNRMQSAGGKHEGPMVNFVEVRRQIMNQRLAAPQQHPKSRHHSRRSMGTRSLSRASLTSVGSNDVWLSTTPRNVSPVEREETKPVEEQVSVWKGDSQILAIDLKRELTAKVKSKIASTESALERATGYGDDNFPRAFVGPLEEYPYLVEEDYSHVAKIPQKVRISPHLSEVIRTDINVRMGRPRYHEIREKDLDMWNRGSQLDRSYRNLKVFNWLHSLRETEFDMRMPEAVDDISPGGDVTTRDEVVVSVDEPKIKPLFERLKKELYIL